MLLPWGVQRAVQRRANQAPTSKIADETGETIQMTSATPTELLAAYLQRRGSHRSTSKPNRHRQRDGLIVRITAPRAPGIVTAIPSQATSTEGLRVHSARWQAAKPLARSLDTIDTAGVPPAVTVATPLQRSQCCYLADGEGIRERKVRQHRDFEAVKTSPVVDVIQKRRTTGIRQIFSLATILRSSPLNASEK